MNTKGLKSVGAMTVEHFHEQDITKAWDSLFAAVQTLTKLGEITWHLNDEVGEMQTYLQLQPLKRKTSRMRKKKYRPSGFL